MKAKLRIARATNDLARVSKMYTAGLDLSLLASFKDHSGFDGIVLGADGLDYHFEFTSERGQLAPASNSPEQLIVFYLPDLETTQNWKSQMVAAGFTVVKSHNPYWDQYGCTFEDFEGYRVVLCHRKWPE